MSTGTLDHDSVQAIGVLVRAVEQARVPGVLEFRQLSNALNRAIQSRSERDLDEAGRVFQTLDRDLRARIEVCADSEARAEAARRGAAPAGVVPRPSVRPPASGFLAALNGVRAAPADSRSAAKARLLAAVEDQRSTE